MISSLNGRNRRWLTRDPEDIEASTLLFRPPLQCDLQIDQLIGGNLLAEDRKTLWMDPQVIFEPNNEVGVFGLGRQAANRLKDPGHAPGQLDERLVSFHCLCPILFRHSTERRREQRLRLSPQH